MRPPQITGENDPGEGDGAGGGTTSMRPPQITGENTPSRARRRRAAGTSMRPPQITGENQLGAFLWPGAPPHFNEAPADHGGKQHLLEAATQAACGPRMREVAICSLTIGPPTPTRGARVADNNLILKEQSTVRAVPRRRAVTGALAVHRRVQTMIGSRSTGVKDRLPSETTVGLLIGWWTGKG